MEHRQVKYNKKGKYTDKIMNAVKQHIGLNEDDESMDDTIMNMSKAEVFKRYCQWSELLGSWYHTLLDIIEDIYDITLKTKEPK